MSLSANAAALAPQHFEFKDTSAPSSSFGNDKIYRWAAPITARLRNLLRLPPNWDSVGARQIDPRNAMTAVNILEFIMDDDTPVPEVFPTVCGGVQLEWGKGDSFAEIEITTPTHIEVLFQHGPDEEPTENRLQNNDLSQLRDVVGRVER